MLKQASIPHVWLGITDDWSAKTLLRLMEEVLKRGIDPKDFDAVRVVWAEIKDSDRRVA